MFFTNVSQAFKDGLVTPELVDEWIELVYPEEQRAEKRAEIIAADGSLSQFRLSALHRMAREAAESLSPAPSPAPPSSTPEPELPPIPPELMDDIPAPVYDTPLPDLAAEIKSRLGIIAGVRMFGKPQDHIRDTRVEGIKVRCPVPSHNDEHPSAWVNTDKNVWTCGKCQIGGDVIDFYAARQGMPVPDYHKNGSFNELVKRMGGELGLQVVKRGTSWEIEEEEAEWPSPLPDRPEAVEEPEPQDVPAEDDKHDPTPDPEPAVPPSSEADEPVTITEGQMLAGIIVPDDEEDLDGFVPTKPIPQLNWRELPIHPESFLGMWMKYADKYFPWVPPEYFLFVGLQAIGLATGHFVTSFTGARLSGSLMVAIIGPSGHGKSTAVKEARAMFGRIPATAFRPEEGTGIKIIPSPGSAEALVKSIYTEVMDPAGTDPSKKMEVGVTAWLNEDELATIVEKSRRRGGGTMKTRIIQLYDFVKSKPEKETVIEDFSMSGGLRTLHDTYFSAVFTTQTDAVRNIMDRVDLISGFLNRIIPVMGVPRVRRKIADAVTPPSDPVHDKAFEALWRRCRDRVRQVPFTQEALEMVDSHPFLDFAENLAVTDSLYSRVNHMTMRLAFLLAINNGENEVDVGYVTTACEIGSRYLTACFGQLRAAVVATETDECADRIKMFADRYYQRHGTWPTLKQWTNDRSYRDFDSATKNKALEALANDGRMVRITLTKGKAAMKVFVVPDGKWSGYVGSDEKSYEFEKFYGIPQVKVDP